MMTENITLNRQAVADIVQDLTGAGFIEQSSIREGGDKVLMDITFTKAGCNFIAAYAQAFHAIGHRGEAHEKIFHLWLKVQAVKWAEHKGLIAGKGGVGDGH